MAAGTYTTLWMNGSPFLKIPENIGGIPKFGQHIGIIYGLDKDWGLALLKELWPRYKDLPIQRYTKQSIEFGDGTIITLLGGRESRRFVGDTVPKSTIEDDIVYCGRKIFIADGKNNFMSETQWLRNQTVFS